jgi:hypothetical protein
MSFRLRKGLSKNSYVKSKLNVIYLEVALVLSVEGRRMHVVSFVPLEIAEAAVVSLIFYDLVPGCFGVFVAFDGALSQAENLLSLLGPEWRATLIIDCDWRSHLLEDGVGGAWH